MIYRIIIGLIVTFLILYLIKQIEEALQNRKGKIEELEERIEELESNSTDNIDNHIDYPPIPPA